MLSKYNIPTFRKKLTSYYYRQGGYSSFPQIIGITALFLVLHNFFVTIISRVIPLYFLFINYRQYLFDIRTLYSSLLLSSLYFYLLNSTIKVDNYYIPFVTIVKLQG